MYNLDDVELYSVTSCYTRAKWNKEKLTQITLVVRIERSYLIYM